MATVIAGDWLKQKGYLVAQYDCVTRSSYGLAQTLVQHFGLPAQVYERRPGQDRTASECITPGTISLHPVNHQGQILVALYGQVCPGRPGGCTEEYKTQFPKLPPEKRPKYFAECLKELLWQANPTVPMYFPDQIGCTLEQGGSWTYYRRCIDHFATRYKGRVYIVTSVPTPAEPSWHKSQEANIEEEEDEEDKWKDLLLMYDN